MNPLHSSMHPPRVVTVAFNPALDQTIEVAGLQPGAVNRALRMQIDAGGKAINVASCLSDFGVNAAVAGQLGRGNAMLFEALFERKKIANHCCYLDGLTRVNTKLADTVTGETTDLNMPGPEFAPDAAADLLSQVLERLERLAEHVDWIVLSGSLPPGIPVNAYATIITRMQAAGIPVLLDTSGAPLKAALAAGPRMIKPNRYELAELLDRPLGSLASLVAAGRDVLHGSHGSPAPEWVVVSLGSDGALFLTREQTLHAHPVPVAVTSTVGAGDAMAAGLIAARLEDQSLIETAQLATAFSAAKLMRRGPHLPHPAEVRALAGHVAVSVID
ncbi:MAG TPA: 1-phosphofructokinase [Candidatus Competibacteraceae bacterium]|nr:1-phosphofructokinase [Candidatus Competibacteraceae bacterium]HRY19340.1 1-phosphofructokinase [Candidatus Competibacteraceae bacterium]